MKQLIGAMLASCLLFTACKKDAGSNPNEKGPMDIEFDNIAGNQDLELNSATYSNSFGETFNITRFDYYISNIKLRDAAGKEYVVPQDDSYFLIKENDPGTRMPELQNIPAGDYTQITLTIGVDSARCAADVSKRTGVLDISGEGQGMYWAWNSGYIFLKLEGTSPASTAAGNVLQYHIGGFGGYDTPTLNNIKTVTLDFPSPAIVRAGRKPHLHILADALKVVNGPTNIRFADHSTEHFSAYSVNYANNYQSMLSVDHVHND